MKIVNIFICIISFQYWCKAQDNAISIQQPLKVRVKETKMNYVISLRDPDGVKPTGKTDECQEIVITGIPMSTQVITSLNIELAVLGYFSFKKHSSLEIPYDREVFIEDKLTGKIFNLKSPLPYTFHADQFMQNRFVIHVLDKTNPQTISAN